MTSNGPHPKLFGVALDVSDDPFSVHLKKASVWAQVQGQTFYQDPYEAINEHLAGTGIEIDRLGRFPLQSWLGPRPLPSDVALLTQEQARKFLNGNGSFNTACKLRDFILSRILPGLPVMAGIDHSASGGVISALSHVLGPENLTVVVLDHHFDGLPVTVRMGPFVHEGKAFMPMQDSFFGTFGKTYCCGNFWAHLIYMGIVKPEHLVFMGVADYPQQKVPLAWEAFRDAYLAFETRGCSFLPLTELQTSCKRKIERFLAEKINTPYVYVSLDLDVGAYRCVRAARYMDGPGIEGHVLSDIARVIGNVCESGKSCLVGLDVMEFNMHLLGAEIEPGIEDQTLGTAIDFIESLIRPHSEAMRGTGRKHRPARGET